MFTNKNKSSISKTMKTQKATSVLPLKSYCFFWTLLVTWNFKFHSFF